MKNLTDIGFVLFAGAAALSSPAMVYLSIFA